jgi:ribonuclease P protein component
LRRRADFDRVFAHGRHNSGRLLAVRSVPNEEAWTRYGFSVSKRVGKAVTRNRVRRRLRELMRSLTLRRELTKLIERARLLTRE